MFIFSCSINCDIPFSVPLGRYYLEKQNLYFPASNDTSSVIMAFNWLQLFDASNFLFICCICRVEIQRLEATQIELLNRIAEEVDSKYFSSKVSLV